jgi:hypothetical protein
MSSSFKGNWLVNYDPAEFKYLDILLSLAQIQDYFDKIGSKFNSININFNKNNDKNYYFKEKEDIFLILNDIKGEFQETGSKPNEIAQFKPLKKAIKTISLLFPRLESDPRWKTMGLPAGHMLLASSLKASGFAPTARSLSLSGENRLPEALSADMTGITLFEDLLPLLRPLLADFKGSNDSILAVGGPFPTLSPLSAIYHLPKVNLFVRGEAEMALPGILRALNRRDAAAFFENEGIFWQQPGVIAMAGFDRVNRPEDLSALAVNLDFLRPAELEKGLEMNFSRGCRRGCVFCCRVQGTRFRKLPLEKVKELLEKYNVIAKNTGRDDRATTHSRYTININDDDILQDPDYARGIFALIREHGMRIFGVQTSTASLVNGAGDPAWEVLDLVADPGLYVGGKPLLWLGTDAFLPARARRLGKKLPPREKFGKLLGELEKREIRHYHYWISSDGESDWEEFVGELALIFSFCRDFPGFGLLAHAPFIVPYPSSTMFCRLPVDAPRLKIKLALDAPDARFSYKVVERLETHWPQLNNLLENDRAGGEKGFFDFLKEKDLMAAAQLAYHFLKQEQLRSSVLGTRLIAACDKLENVIGRLIGNRT